MFKIKFFPIAILVSFFIFLGCSEDDDNNITSPDQPGNSYVKVVHASPDAPGVDLLVDDTTVGEGLAFPNNTGYLTVEVGTRNIKVNVANTQTTVIEADLTFEEEEYYSIYAVNTVDNIEPIVINDDLTEPASGKAHVRFLHLSPDAPAVDITLTNGTVVFPNTVFKQYSNFIPLDAGTYNLQVRLAGTETVVLDLPEITLQEGTIYSVFARGLVSGTGDQALDAEIIVVN